MKERVIEFGVGLLFGIALIVAGMTDPGKVIGFLDLAGAWDPSLALVMGGAIAVGSIGFALAQRRAHGGQPNLLGGPMHLPGTKHIDTRLVAGSLAFGAGWGLAGFCPGPAIVSAGAGQPKAVVFLLAMGAGMVVFELFERRRHAAATAH